MMKRILTIIALCGCILSQAQAPVQSVERNLIQNRTSLESLKKVLVMDQAWVPYPSYNDRAGWDRMMGEYKKDIIANGEKYLDYAWQVVEATDYIEFEKSGDRDIMQVPLNANISAIASLFAAELAEGKGRFVPMIANGVWHTCEMTSWALSAHLAPYSYAKRSLPVKGDNTLELTQGGISQMFSWIYYFLKDELDKLQPEISKRLKEEIKYRELDSYLEREDFWWMGFAKTQKQNNWNPWCNSNALLCFMLMEDDPERLAQGVWKTVRSVDLYINDIQGDGGIEEGPSYWGHAAGKLYDYLNALYMITGGKLSIFDEKMVRDMGEYIVRSYVGDGWCVNFADASARSGAGGMDLIYRYGNAVGSDLMKGYAVMRSAESPFQPSVSIDISRYLESLLHAREFKAAKEEFTPSHYTWYPETEFHYMSNDQGVYVATRGGYNDESHNHNDIGSFNLYYDNMPVIIDVGVGTYTRQTFSSERYSIWTMQSNYHNVPMINGVPQEHGFNFRAADAKSTPTTFSVDISKAYPEAAAVKKWVRAYKMDKNVLTVTDSFTLSEAKEPNQINFMTWGDVDLSVPGIVTVEVSGRKMELKYDKNAFSAGLETIELSDNKLSSVWGHEIYRVSLKAKKLQKSGNYRYIISKK